MRAIARVKAVWILGLATLSPLALNDLRGQEAEKPAAVEWLTGPALEKQLDVVTGIAWEDNPIRAGLQNLSHRARVAIFLDRRVDPSRRVSVAVSAPFASLLEEIATAHNERYCGEDGQIASAIGVARIGPVFYVGPAALTAKLRTVVELRKEELRKLPMGARQLAGRMHAWKWDEAATPKDLIDQLATDSKIAVAGNDRTPHDLWPAADLPPLSFVERLSLLLAGFDLTFRWEESGQSVHPEKIKLDDVVLTRLYAAGAKPQDFADQVRTLIPKAKVEVAGNQVSVTATAEEHQKLEDARQRARNPMASSGKPREKFSLTTTNATLISVLNKLKQQKKLVFKIDQAALADRGLSLQTNISLNVKDVELDELLKLALSQAGMAFKRTDLDVEIFPAPEK